MKPQLALGMGQRITMTPQLVQSIRLLQLSAPQLERELLDALEDNVLLELDEKAAEAADEQVTAAESPEIEVEWDDTLPESWAPMLPPQDDGDGESRWRVAEQANPRARVLEQVALSIDGPAELALALAIVDAVDDSGYLTRPLDELRAETDSTLDAGQAEALLDRIQRFDPVGYAARNLAECLRRQLQEMNADEPARALALRLVDEQLEALAWADGAELAARMEVPVTAVVAAVSLIHRLDPKPGASEGEAAAVVPDLVVRPRGEGWVVELNPGALPRVRLNAGYERVINDQAAGASSALRQQLQEARWLVRSLQMRHETLLAVGEAIFRHQHAFLRSGDEGLKALTLKEIGEQVGVHESTVSRITTSKYVQTPLGVFSLKHFFPSQLAGAEGVETSGAAVKAMIRRMIGTEPTDRPLRDVDIAAILARRGVRVARRTVAKYREALGIASSKVRAQLGERPPLARGRTGGGR